MDVLSSRLERLKQQRLEQRIAVSGNELDILKNEIRFDLIVCGGSLDVVVSILYWLMASNTLPPLTLIFTGFVMLALFILNNASEIQQAVARHNEDPPLFKRIRETLQVYLQLLVWPKIFFNWYFSIREEHSNFFYVLSGGFFVWLYQLGNSISGVMAIYLLLLAYFTFPLIGISVCFDWMLCTTGKQKETPVPSEESLLPEHTEENEKLWELSVAEEIDDKNIIEEFQPSLTGLQLGSELKIDDEESIGLDLQLDQTSLPDLDETNSSNSSFEEQNMNYSVHHFSSSGNDDTSDMITSKLEDASRETVHIPTSRNPSSKSSTQRGVSDSEDEEGLDVESFEVISREEFNL